MEELTLSPYKKLETEIVRLRALYLTAIYSFNQTARTITQKMKSGKLDPEEPVAMEFHQQEKLIVANNAYAFLQKTNSQFPRYLRETIFVRLISSFEAFLLDISRYIFLERRDFFYSENRIEFSFGEILSTNSITDLWTKLINKEIRKLQNQGFKEIVKFYTNRFNFNFHRLSVPLDSIQEFHDRRHILVHRLGKTDDEYKHRYNTSQKSLTVNENYLLEAMHVLQQFACFITEEAQFVINSETEEQKLKQSEQIVKLEVETLSDAARKVIAKEFCYNVGDKIKCLGDILRSHSIENHRQNLVIGGERSIINAYLKIIKKLNRENKLILHKQKVIYNFPYRCGCNLPVELLESIVKTLPPQPWKKDIHKEIAQRFDISNSKARVAISQILQDGRLSSFVSKTGENKP